MLAKENEYLQEAAQSIYIANSDDIVRQQCRAREEAERYERTVARDMRKVKELNSQLTTDNALLKATNEHLNAHIRNMKAQINHMSTMIKELQKQIDTKEK